MKVSEIQMRVDELMEECHRESLVYDMLRAYDPTEDDNRVPREYQLQRRQGRWRGALEEALVLRTSG